MSENETVESIEKSELFKVIEAVVEKVLSKYFTPEVVSYFSLVSISGARKKNYQKNWMNTQSICELLKVTRQTLNNWKKNEKTKHLIAPFIYKINNQNFFDPIGICVIVSHNRERFRYRNYDGFLRSKENDQDFRFQVAKAKIIGKQTVTEKEMRFYWDECEIRGEENLQKKKYLE